MTSEKSATLSTITSTLGVQSKAALALYSPAEIYRRIRNTEHECGWNELQRLHAEAKKENDDLRILEKSILTRASPLLPDAIRLGMKHPDVSLQDYEEWFGDRAAQYASPGEVSSMFSPAAYLTELYREARSLYNETSPFHIDTRRPDLKNLVLSQENMSQEVMALTLSNEILMERTRTAMKQGDTEPGDDDVMQALSTHVSSSNTPYHLHHNRLRQVCLQKDPDFRQMLAAPKVLGHLSGATLAGVYYDIPPALYQLLTEKIPEDEAEQKAMFERNFGENLQPEALLNPEMLRSWYGLTDAEVQAFIGVTQAENAQYSGAKLKTSVGGIGYELTYELISGADNDIKVCRIYPLGGTRWKMDFKRDADSAYPFAEFFIDRTKTDNATIKLTSTEFGDDRFIKSKIYSADFNWPDSNAIPSIESMIRIKKHTSGWYNYNFKFTIARHTNIAYLLKLNKAIRLYKATGLPPYVLEDIVNSVDPNQITDDTLTLLFRTALLMKHYNLSHEDALVFSAGLISQSKGYSELSQWDRLFNSPAIADGGFTGGGDINFQPEKATEQSDIKSTLKRAFRTDDAGLYALRKIQDSSRPTDNMSLSLKRISEMYTLSLWARHHDLTPHELLQLLTLLALPAKLYNEPQSVWLGLMMRLQATVDWLRARNWSVADLALMTREVKDIPAGTDINNLLATLRVAAAATELPENPVVADYAQPLAPPLSAALNLPGDAISRTLLLWANTAKPGDKTLAEFWTILIKGAPAAAETVAATAFAYGLAQMALIVHATGVMPEALALFVAKPDQLTGVDPNPDKPPKTELLRSAEVIIALSKFSDWFRTLADTAGSGAALASSLAAADVTPALLAQATGLPAVTVTQAVAEAKKYGDVADAAKLASWQEISVVQEWTALAQAFGVTPSDIGHIVALNYRTGTSGDTWADWKKVADVFVAGLRDTQQQATEEDVATRLSGVLSGWLLAKNITPGVKSRESLFSYLLSDNLNGPQVRTSKLAEAIASLQTFIHRTLNLVPGTPEASGVMREALDRLFFRDWAQWNARYSTWASGRKLMYYPENYIDPTQRLGQTRMMDDMLQVLGQAQISTDTVGDAFMGYLTGFEEVANLDTVSGYHDSSNPDEGKTWFVGRNQSTPAEYWWRSVDEGKRSPEGGLPANAWTGWDKITAAPQPIGRLIRPVIYKERLYVGWIERKRYVVTRDEKGEEVLVEYRWELKVSWLRYDGGWSQPAVYTYPADDAAALDALLSPENDLSPDDLSLYLSAWPEKQMMMAGVYQRGAGNNAQKQSFEGEVLIYEDMTFEKTIYASSNWVLLKDMLDDDDHSIVLFPFTPGTISVENTLTSPSVLPPGFTRFDATIKASVIEVDSAGTSYRLRVGVTENVSVLRPEVENRYIDALIFCFPELQSETSPVRVLIAGEDIEYRSLGAFLVRREGSEWWAYLVEKNMFWENVRYSEVSRPIEESGEVKAVHNSPAGLVYCAKFKLTDVGTYLSYITLTRWRDGHDYQTVYARNLVSIHPNQYEVIERTIIPTAYGGSPVPDIIPGTQITSQISGGGGGTNKWYVYGRDLDISSGSATLTWGEYSYPVPGEGTFTFSGDEVIHTLTLSCGSGKTRTWELRVYKVGEALNVDIIGVQKTDGECAQYLEHADTRTRLNTLFARQLTEKAVSGIDGILNFDTQSLPEPPLKEGDVAGQMDFSGANAIYFWELFYYTPMMMMQRFLQEERYDLAEKWLKYIFSPSGYIVHGVPEARIWNVRPLHEDISWNDEPLVSYDPDAVAQNDPMHYKLNAFMRLLDITLGRGDAAYRKLERDTLQEAKVWYGRALSLLGEAPWIEPGLGWSDPTLRETSSEQVLNARMDTLSQMVQGIRRSKDIPLTAIAGSTTFLPEANEVMLGYWETLRIRLYNLRHNLTIDGQPLALTLFAPPADPEALLAAAVAAEGGSYSDLPSITAIPALRFTPLLESARSMASQLIGFGSSMQQILLSQDAEALAELLTTQGAEIASSSLAVQKQTLNELAAERITLEKSLETTTGRLNHYRTLYDQNMNAGEVRAMNQLQHGQNTVARARGALIAGAAMNLAPNLFGLANGGSKWGAVAEATALGFTIDGEMTISGATRLAQEEQYRRRREEWEIQYRTAEKEIRGIEAQLSALSVRETSVKMQIAHAERQSAHATAQLALFNSKFTGKAMYSWLRGRLATIFYQYYDLTASLCLMAQKSLQWEKGDTTSYLKTGTWNGAWAGLMSGEGLMLSLAQMEMAWMKHQKRELEVTRTVSLANFFAGKLDDHTLSKALGQLLAGNTEGSIGVAPNTVALIKDVTNDTFSLGINFSLKDLGAGADYAGHNMLRVRSIAVTLPGLLGPYQNVRARLRTNVADTQLPAGCNECAISHAMQDNGLFLPDGTGDARWGARWLPFEGMDVNDESGMTLSFADAAGEQKTLLESLSDAIVHIQFTVR
ncbi:neuraminidase-like domain-containing protein [Enterobacter hormaechei]|nr:neuraminidase-like domain-containing protein [Enterobacter hormaechei]